MPDVSLNYNVPEQSSGWWNGGQRTATGTVLGNFWNEVSGKNQEMEYNSYEAGLARQFNSAEAQKARDFEEYMSNTAHQRAVADMKAAGLNPMLAAGDAASTPNAPAASAHAASVSGTGNGGFAGVIAHAAFGAIARGLLAKFTGSAMKAADNHELVAPKIAKLAAQERYYSARAARIGSYGNAESPRHTPEEDDDDMSDEEMYRILASIRKPS